MDELHTMFSDFEKRIEEISAHAEQVHTVNFSAKLKNGTSFGFSYNSDAFKRQREAHPGYSPTSIFNAVVDVTGFCSTIFLLVYILTRMERLQLTYQTRFLLIVTYALIIGTFAMFALFHLFDSRSSVKNVFLNVGEAAKIIFLACTNILMAMASQSPHTSLVLFLSILTGASALLFLSAGTKGGTRASLVLAVLLPFFSLFVRFSLLSVSQAVLFALWSLTNLILPNDVKARTSTVFAIMGTIVLSLGFFMPLP